MKQLAVGVGLLICSLAILVLAACNSGTAVSVPTTEPATSTANPSPAVEATMTSSSSTPPAGGVPSSTGSSYPKMGHAPDYSWIAGRVNFTRIQGGCTYIITEEPTPGPTEAPIGAGTMIVGTAVQNDTSPPLRDITPIPPASQPTQQIGTSFVPGGDAWSGANAKNGDYVVLFGHVAGPGEPREMCPGGTAYVVDRVLMNP